MGKLFHHIQNTKDQKQKGHKMMNRHIRALLAYVSGGITMVTIFSIVKGMHWIIWVVPAMVAIGLFYYAAKR